MVTEVGGFPDIPNPPLRHVLEEMQRSSVAHVVPDGRISTAHEHVAGLPLARVPEGAIGTELVSIPKRRALVACEKQHSRRTSRSANPSLPLPTVACVDVLQATVYRT